MDDKLPGYAARQTTHEGGATGAGSASGSAARSTGLAGNTGLATSTELTGSADLTGSAGTAGRAPSRPWFGGLILTCLTLAAVWVLTYTLAPLPGQRSLGGWNYAVVGALLTAFIWLSKAWQGEEPQRS